MKKKLIGMINYKQMKNIKFNKGKNIGVILLFLFLNLSFFNSNLTYARDYVGPADCSCGHGNCYVYNSATYYSQYSISITLNGHYNGIFSNNAGSIGGYYIKSHINC